MRVAVIGSRSINVDMAAYIPVGVTALISGSAWGVESLAERWADEHKVPKLIIKADYERYGRLAAARRDELIVELADLVVAVWDGVSAGTRHTIEYARNIGKTVWVHMIQQKLA
ncbi:MAG: SLOG family protein [Eubacteriales bacterium]|nr:SLOG family protein [Eubacteriales bacterium]